MFNNKKWKITRYYSYGPTILMSLPLYDCMSCHCTLMPLPIYCTAQSYHCTVMPLHSHSIAQSYNCTVMPLQSHSIAQSYHCTVIPLHSNYTAQSLHCICIFILLHSYTTTQSSHCIVVQCHSLHSHSTKGIEALLFHNNKYISVILPLRFQTTFKLQTNKLS